MTKEQIEQKLQRLEKFNDPVLLMMIFLSIPALLMVTVFASLGGGTLVKIMVAVCFILFTWLAVKVNALIKQRIDELELQLKALD